MIGIIVVHCTMYTRLAGLVRFQPKMTTSSIGYKPRQAVKLGTLDALGLLIKARDDWAPSTSLY